MVIGPEWTSDGIEFFVIGFGKHHLALVEVKSSRDSLDESMRILLVFSVTVSLTNAFAISLNTLSIASNDS